MHMTLNLLNHRLNFPSDSGHDTVTGGRQDMWIRTSLLSSELALEDILLNIVETWMICQSVVKPSKDQSPLCLCVNPLVWLNVWKVLIPDWTVKGLFLHYSSFMVYHKNLLLVHCLLRLEKL